jgi:hypothetical protein
MYYPDIPTEVFPAYIFKFISDFNFPQHGRFRIYELVETTKVVSIRTLPFQINLILTVALWRKRAIEEWLWVMFQNLTSVETSVAIYLGLSAEADTLHYD